MLFGNTTRGKESYLTVIMNQMLAKLYDQNEYFVYDTMREKVENGEAGDAETFMQTVREFRVTCLYELLEAIERQYEGFTEKFEERYSDLADNDIGIDYQEVIRFGPDIRSMYLLICNIILDQEFDEESGPDAGDKFYDDFRYNMEELPRLEAAAINASRELLEMDGMLK